MINDSVREELVGKISAASKSGNLEMKANTIPHKMSNPTKTVAAQKPADAPQSSTAEISAKPTSPTLVEFHNKNAAMPEWRLQLQNAVRQHQDRGVQETEANNTSIAARAKLVTSGANALKVDSIPNAKPTNHKNPNLARALERIETSRQKFLVEEKQPLTDQSQVASAPKANKNYPFYIAGKTTETTAKPAEVNAPINAFAKPKLAATLRTETKDFDTNKLPPLPKPVPLTENIETAPAPPVNEIKEPLIAKTEKVEVKLAENIEIVEPETIEVEEFDDCAPFAMRFNAGLFDLIIGSFTSLILLAPFMILGGSWLTPAGVFAFLATCAVIMFIYLTTAVGFYGKTFGMRLFSLEIVDVESEDYPTFHQAAVNAAVYLLTLALGGIGFLTLPFNEDRRAIHDLLSGTIMVKE